MDFDISNVLDHWDYKPGCVVVRKFNGNDGKEKIQLRVDLGLLQMNAEGRPDGKQPFGHPSLLEFYQAKLSKHTASAGENAEEFKLTPEDCARLQLEALQYHHRYICLLQLNDYAGVIRDTERNLSVFNLFRRRTRGNRGTRLVAPPVPAATADDSHPRARDEIARRRQFRRRH
jgi:hypothetical protein